MDQQIASYKGSIATFELVKGQIAERFGDKAADSYKPETNCHTLRTWNTKGFKVKRGEKALKSFTFVEKDNDGNKRKFRKPVFLFFESQVEPTTKS